MGLDLFVRKQKDFRTENGRQCYTVETITNLRKCHNTLDALSNYLDDYIDNCTTVNAYGKYFVGILNNLEELKEQYDNKSEDLRYNNPRFIETDEEFTERCEAKSKDLAYEIEKLENLIAEENLTEDSEDIYEIHAWW